MRKPELFRAAAKSNPRNRSSRMQREKSQAAKEIFFIEIHLTAIGCHTIDYIANKITARV